MQVNESRNQEERTILILLPYLKKLCYGKWLNLEPEDRLSEAALFTLCATRSLPLTSGHFIPDLNAAIFPHMKELNRKTPSRFYAQHYSLDRQRATSNGDSWGLRDVLTGSELDDSVIMIRSYLRSLPCWKRELLLDLAEGLSKSAAARKHQMSVYMLDKTVKQLWEDYQSAKWTEK